MYNLTTINLELITINIKVGHGYDVHKLVTNRPLIIGGVSIPYEAGLLGHSDADVLTHAIIDALLGATALGDIGTLFPDNDPQYQGISSLALLKAVYEKMQEQSWQVGNVDATIIAQAPKLLPYKGQMVQNIKNILQGDINIKATTEEGLGFTGAKEGIAAHAVCLIYKN